MSGVPIHLPPSPAVGTAAVRTCSTVSVRRLGHAALVNCLQVAERLYTSGYSSYPRTESSAHPFDSTSRVRPPRILSGQLVRCALYKADTGNNGGRNMQ